MEGYYTARVSSVDADKGFVKVTYPKENDLVSEWLPLLAFEYEMPEIGSLVAVVVDKYENGVVLGKIFSHEQPPPGNSGYIKKIDNMTITKNGNAFKVDFGDGGYIQYSNGVMTLNASKIILNGYTP